jgi:hypothetical protein
VRGAAFDPTGTWLAGIDAAGRLWRVDTNSGAALRMADGPYGGSIAFARNGELLLVEGISAGAPYESRLVRLDPRSGRAASLYAEPGFVFSARELADGSVAAVVHPFGAGVVVVRIDAGHARPVADLGARAIDVSISDDGATIAYAVAGSLYAEHPKSARPVRIGAGELPRVAPGGRSVLALRGGQSVVLTVDGRETARLDSPTITWAACAEECPS